MQWKTEADDATCFEIFKYEDSYIVHGELAITRLNRNGEILWQQSGRDIFTTPNGKDDFTLKDNYVYATDWEGNRYVLDCRNGDVIGDDPVATRTSR